MHDHHRRHPNRRRQSACLILTTKQRIIANITYQRIRTITAVERDRRIVRHRQSVIPRTTRDDFYTIQINRVTRCIRQRDIIKTFSARYRLDVIRADRDTVISSTANNDLYTRQRRFVRLTYKDDRVRAITAFSCNTC